MAKASFRLAKVYSVCLYICTKIRGLESVACIGTRPLRLGGTSLDHVIIPTMASRKDQIRQQQNRTRSLFQKQIV